MAKDGTRIGGARVGAGRKKKALVDKINEGKKTETIEFSTPVLKGEDMPPIKDYMIATQKNLGSITEIDGGEIEAVDVISMGSPCQDLSIAGKREGLVEGKRSRGTRPWATAHTYTAHTTCRTCCTT